MLLLLFALQTQLDVSTYEVRGGVVWYLTHLTAGHAKHPRHWKWAV
jgi:hypothetical protein